MENKTNWPKLYILLMVNLGVLILIFYWITRYYS